MSPLNNSTSRPGSRRQSLALFKERQLRDQSIKPFWEKFYQDLHRKKVVPIISNTVRNNRIFDDAMQASVSDINNAYNDVPIEEALALQWAEAIGYPLRIDHLEPECPLARVAQFNYIANNADQEIAKRRYLHFLKESILTIAEDDVSVSNEVPGLRDQIDDLSFADIVSILDYPCFDDQNEDPLRRLASLKLPIYVTTSYYDFMERALEAVDIKNVRTQFCLWNSKSKEKIDSKHQPDPNLVPSAEAPVVYHLHGLETYPSSLVLSEDDYMDYMLAVARNNDANRPLIPHYLKEALAGQSLLLLGYRLQDWDFRTLFRGLIEPQLSELPRWKTFSNIAIQLDPKHQQLVADEQKARDYLSSYFKKSTFEVEWDSSDRFISRLWEEWNR